MSDHKERISEGNFNEWTPREMEAFVLGALRGAQACGLDIEASKIYDPMVIEGQIGDYTCHSYTFDMLDGGRHHKVKLLSDVAQIVVAEIACRATEEDFNLSDYWIKQAQWYQDHNQEIQAQLSTPEGTESSVPPLTPEATTPD